VFGCQVFSHIDKSKQRKLGRKSSEGIFVGYASYCLAWLIYNPNTRSITRTSMVVFNEQWKPHEHGQSTKCTSNETELQVKTPRNFASSGDVNNSSPSTGDVESVESFITTPLTSSFDIHRINQVTDYVEHQDYVLNLFDRMGDADIDPEEYYGMITYADAHADSLVDSPEPQAYFSQVTVTDDVTLRQEIVKPRTYAQTIHPRNTFHREWQTATEK